MIQIIFVVVRMRLDTIYGSCLVSFIDIQQTKPQLELIWLVALGVVVCYSEGNFL